MSSSSATITIANPEKWDIINKEGFTMEHIFVRQIKQISPPLKYNVTGLDPSMLYEAILKLERDPLKQRYRNEKWEGNCESHPVLDVTVGHLESPNYGAFWMEQGIDFSFITPVSDKTLVSETRILMESLHKYTPVVQLQSVPEGAFSLSSRFSSQQMVMVTSLHDVKFKKLRTDWINESGVLTRKRKASESERLKKRRLPEDGNVYMRELPFSLNPQPSEPSAPSTSESTSDTTTPNDHIEDSEHDFFANSNERVFNFDQGYYESHPNSYHH